MSKMVSNNDIMDMFREIDELREDTNLSEEEIACATKKIHDQIVDKLAFLVYNKTRPYRKFPNYEDLVQEGFVGLVKAIKKFEWRKFPNFFIYSDQWIHHSVKRAASRFDIVYNPDKSRVVYTELEEEEEIDEKDTPEGVFFERERSSFIANILNEFSDRDREIIQRIFGLGGFSPQTLREIGPEFNMTYERVRQIKNNVIDKLRKNQALIKLNQS